VADLRSALEAGEPPLLVVELYATWGSVQRDGHIGMPGPGAPMLGGHAVLVVGYRGLITDQGGLFIVHNSWGVAWGDNGYGYLPYAYVERYGRSAWVLAR
jgi:C1A family cysteine protease